MVVNIPPRTSPNFVSHRESLGELPPPYTPERNGVAERRNRSLLDITRCLLLDKRLPGHLWAEAVKAAGDILNLRSTKRHPDKTPTELFYGKKPSISHLRVFGSSAFAHIPKGTRTKLDPRAEQCVLLSFEEAAKAYRCYMPSTRKVFISRDLLINEAAPPKPSSTSITPPTTSVDFTPAPTAIENRRDHSGLPMQPTLESHIDNHLLPPTQTEPDASPRLHESSQSPPTTGCPSPSSPAPCTSPTHTTEPNQEDAEPLISPLHFSVDKAAPIHSPPADHLWRSERVRRFPKHLHDFAAHLQLHPQDLVPEDVTETLTFQQARLDPKWRHAMHEEIASIYQNQTWTLVPLPPHKKAITSHWVFKVKPGLRSDETRYKARLVARGFEQIDGVDFVETFAPVVRWKTIRTLIAIVVHLNWPIHQLDVLTAFLNGILKEDVYMLQPPGFITAGAEHLVCKPHKSLYGLKQSPRAWYARLHAALLAWKRLQSHLDPNLYFAHFGPHTIALLVYVDDILLTGSSLRLINKLKDHLHQTFQTKDLGPIQRYLGVQFERNPTGVRMHQTDYAHSILRQFGMEHCAPSPTPLPEGTTLSKESATPLVHATLYRMLVGKLLFLTKTRPDITHAVSVVSRFMQNPQEAHLQAAKHILHYLRRHPDLGLFFQQGEDNRLNGYTDADYGQDIDDRISVGAYIFFFGNSPISWNSKKQSSTSRSSCESEYRALPKCSCEAI